MVLKFKNKSGKLIGTLRDHDSEPAIERCEKCDGTGWDFKDTSPPFEQCICKKEKEIENADIC
tara:strand:- start:221 stop:409 length:189 start_codon:yes stop_codon:yes gene_type:complete